LPAQLVEIGSESRGCLAAAVVAALLAAGCDCEVPEKLPSDRGSGPADASDTGVAAKKDVGVGPKKDSGGATKKDAGDGRPWQFPDGSLPACTTGKGNPTVLGLAAKTWYEVPGSVLDNGICACNHGFPEACAGYGSLTCRGVLSYSGAAYSACRNQLLVWGGGHNDYYGNEVYAFDLGSLSWERLTNPSTPADHGVCAETLADGTPGSRHTYDGISYLEHADQLFSMGGSPACGQGGGSNSIWIFDLTTRKWQPRTPTCTNFTCGGPYDEPYGYFPFNFASSYDPVTRQVYVETTWGLYAYNHEANTLTRLVYIYDDYGSWLKRTAAVIPGRRLFVVIGETDTAGVSRTVVYDLARTPVTIERWTTLAPQEIANAGAPGVAYDSSTDTVVAWAGGEVYRLDLDTRTWTGLGASWVPPAPGDAADLYGRWRYLPREDAFVVVPAAETAVRIFKNGK
jgi:hypothetical protein